MPGCGVHGIALHYLDDQTRSDRPVGRMQLVAKDAEIAANAILEAMTLSLIGGQRIETRRFGSFAINCHLPRAIPAYINDCASSTLGAMNTR